MENICLECGFTKYCSADEFMEHMMFHDYLEQVLEELGMVQEYDFEISFSFEQPE
jgi:hypothetical protein